jgi:uridylate kinase
MPAAYERVIVKVSGEALGGDGAAVSSEAARRLAEELREAAGAGVQLGVVVGGGNIVRGVASARRGADRVTADYMGMAATLVNALALGDALENLGQPSAVMSALACGGCARAQDHRAATRLLEDGVVVVFAGGTGSPFFSTDTAAVLRACEVGAQALLKATKADGIYDSDPATNPDARRYRELTYIDVIEKRLAVMDMTAVSLAREQRLPIIVFALSEPSGIARVVKGEPLGTSVKGGSAW